MSEAKRAKRISDLYRMIAVLNEVAKEYADEIVELVDGGREQREARYD